MKIFILSWRQFKQIKTLKIPKILKHKQYILELKLSF